MEEDVHQMTKESLSESLYEVMELAGCSIEKRNIQKECKTASEIIRSVICDHFWGIFSSYVF